MPLHFRRLHTQPLVVLACVAVLVGACGGSPDEGAGPASTATAEPRVVDAVDGLAAAFDGHHIVAIGETHGNRQLAAFLQELVGDERIRSRTHILAVEVGRTAQPAIDAYLAGHTHDEDLLAALRDATFSDTGAADPATLELYRAVRDANESSPLEPWRILAVDSALSWDSVRDPGDLESFDREADMAANLGRVVDDNQTALWVVGGAHLTPGSFSVPDRPTPVGSARGLLDSTHPGATYVTTLYTGFGQRTTQLESRLGSVPSPSVLEIAGSWLADLSDLELGPPGAPGDVMTGGGPGREPSGPLAGVDGLLYLGSCDSLGANVAPPAIFTGEYLAEINRRRALADRPPFDYDAYRSSAEASFGTCTCT
jgi:hypothetical protein